MARNKPRKRRNRSPQPTLDLSGFDGLLQDRVLIAGEVVDTKNRPLSPVVQLPEVRSDRVIPTGSELFPHSPTIEDWSNEVSLRRGSQPTPTHGVLVFSGMAGQYWGEHYTMIFAQIRNGITHGVISKGDGKHRGYWDFMLNYWQDSPQDQYRRYISRWADRLSRNNAAAYGKYLIPSDQEGGLGLIEWVMDQAGDSPADGSSVVNSLLFDAVGVMQEFEVLRAVRYCRGDRETEDEVAGKVGKNGWILDMKDGRIKPGRGRSKEFIQISELALDEVLLRYNMIVAARRLSNVKFLKKQLKDAVRPKMSARDKVAHRDGMIDDIPKPKSELRFDRLTALADKLAEKTGTEEDAAAAIEEAKEK